MTFFKVKIRPLTTNADNFTGGTTNDVFNGNDTTFAIADNIAGGTGTDRLNYLDTSNAGGIPGTSILGVETFYIRNLQTANAGETYDFSTITGETEVWSDRSTDSVTFDALGTGTTVGLNGDGGTVLGAVNFQMATASNAVNIAINGGVGASGTAPAITEVGSNGTATTATITSTGAANTVGTVDLAAATLTSVTFNASTNLKGDFLSQATDEVDTGGVVTISGTASSVEFTAALDNTIATINADGLTGGLTASLGSLVTQKVTGGKGDDVITTNAILTTGSVAAGTGTDTLVTGTMANINTAALGAKYTGFETLRLIHATANTLALDTTVSGITAIELGGDATLSQLTATQAANITLRSNAADGTADDMSFGLFNAAGTSDVLSIVAGLGTTNTSASDIADLVVTGFETVNVRAVAGPTSTAGAGGANDRTTNISGTITGANLTKINLTGTAVNIANIAVANATAGVTIDGSALTGDGASTSVGLTVGGNAVAGSTIIGSSVRDSFIIGAENATYRGGDGNDLFNTTTAFATADGTTDLVMDGGAGTSDSLRLTTFSDVTDAAFTNVSNMEALILDTVAGATTVVKAVLGAAARTAFADGVTVTSGTTADGAKYTFQSGLYNKNVKLTAAVSADGATTADNVEIVTGSGSDTISLTASSWVGHATTGGTITVTTGAGVDTISVTIGGANVLATGIATITAGTGADVITSVGINATTASNQVYVIAAGDSTVTGYDSITGFDAADGTRFASTLDFDSFSVGTYAATAATGFTSAELTVAVAATTGLVTFAGTAAASATLAQKIAAVQSVVVTTAGHTALFTHGSNAYVFNNNATSDSLVELVGLSTATAILSGGNAVTTNGIFVA